MRLVSKNIVVEPGIRDVFFIHRMSCVFLVGLELGLRLVLGFV